MPNVGVTSQTWHVLNRCACACAHQSPCDLYEHGSGRRGDLGSTQPKQMKVITSFMSPEEEKRLKFYLIKGVWGGGGGHPVLARGCKHETCGCLWSLYSMKKLNGPKRLLNITSTKANFFYETIRPAENARQPD